MLIPCFSTSVNVSKFRLEKYYFENCLKLKNLIKKNSEFRKFLSNLLDYLLYTYAMLLENAKCWQKS